jgi:hypothetical protein
MALPAADDQRFHDQPFPDQRFPDQRWTTCLLQEARADQALVAITLALSPGIAPSRAFLPVATFCGITPLPRSAEPWRQQGLSDLAARHARLMRENCGRIHCQP